MIYVYCVSLAVTNSYFVAENTKMCHQKLFMCKKIAVIYKCVCVCKRTYAGVCMHIGIYVGGWGVCVCVCV